MVETLVWLPSFIQPIADFLNIVLLNNSFIFISVWSFVHLLVGGFVYYLLRKKNESFPMIKTLAVLFLFELVEVFLMYVPKIIFPEPVLDSIWDLVVGMIGATFVWLFLDHR